MEVDVDVQPIVMDVQTPEISHNLHEKQISEAQSESPAVETAAVADDKPNSRDTSPKPSSETQEAGEDGAILTPRRRNLRKHQQNG